MSTDIPDNNNPAPAKSARGFTIISNELVTWYFHEEAHASVGQAYRVWDTKKLDALSILKTNALGTRCISSDWPNQVTNNFTLAAKLREI